MLPELILNERYPLSEARVMEAIAQYDFRGTVPAAEKGYQVCRIGGYRLLEEPGGGAQLIGWRATWRTCRIMTSACPPSFVSR